MSTVWRDVDAALRVCEAQMRFAAAAYGVRDWLRELNTERPLLAAIDAMPDTPDVRVLLDPLHDSALTRITEVADADGEAAEPVAEARAPSTVQTPRTVGRVPAGARFAAGAARATPASATQPAVRPGAVSANMPARVAALLARHEDVRRLIAEDAAPRAPWSDARTERRIVPFAAHHAVTGESVARSEIAASPLPLAAMLAQWSEIAATEAAQRLEAATGRALAGYELTQLDSPLASAHAASLPVRAVPTSLERGAMGAQPGLPPAVLRLGDLAAPPPRQDPQEAVVPSGVPASSDAASASLPPATGESVLGRMAGALGRIEERLAASAPRADPSTQWLTEDDTLAERIHDILRRQALRHGIDAP